MGMATSVMMRVRRSVIPTSEAPEGSDEVHAIKQRFITVVSMVACGIPPL